MLSNPIGAVECFTGQLTALYISAKVECLMNNIFIWLQASIGQLEWRVPEWLNLNNVQLISSEKGTNYFISSHVCFIRILLSQIWFKHTQNMSIIFFSYCNK